MTEAGPEELATKGRITVENPDLRRRGLLLKTGFPGL
jgi:hypothetical protein